MLHRFEIGSLLVSERGDKDVKGIITKECIMLRADSLADVRVEDVMKADMKVVSGGAKLGKCLLQCLDGSFRYLPVVGMGGTVDAVLSMGDICRALVKAAEEEAPGVRASAGTVRDVLDCSAASQPQPDDTGGESIADAVIRLRASPTGALLVPASNGEVGIFTERELIRALAQHQDYAWSARMSEHATRVAPPYANASLAITDALAGLLQGGTRHLPVVSEPYTEPPRCALVSMRDLLAHIHGVA